MQRLHIVEAIGQLDYHHPQVLSHRQEHLAQVLGLDFLLAVSLLGRLPRDLAQLGDAVHQLRNLVPEPLLDSAVLHAAVLLHIVQNSSSDSSSVHLELDDSQSCMKRMGDDRVAGEAHLSSVTLGGELISLLDQGDSLGGKILPCPVEKLLSIHQRLVTNLAHTLV